VRDLKPWTLTNAGRNVLRVSELRRRIFFSAKSAAALIGEQLLLCQGSTAIGLRPRLTRIFFAVPFEVSGDRRLGPTSDIQRSGEDRFHR